jgi:hypothetical protein
VASILVGDLGGKIFVDELELDLELDLDLVWE